MPMFREWCLSSAFFLLPLLLSVSVELDCSSPDNGKLSLFRQFRELPRSRGIIVTSHFLGQFNKRQFISTVIFM